jgi:DNA repair exonuclease SbcCD ATPase subunit
VIGPIGAFIKIAEGKENFAPLAELALGSGTLDRFIVTNDHDRKLCQSLRQEARCGKTCGLYQVKVSPRFNVPPPPADTGIETIASVLNITNDIVFNCLVDTNRIDQRALAPSREVSEQHLLKNENGRYSIKGNIKEVFFLPSGDRWTVRDGAMSMVANDRGFRDRKIGVDRTAAIEEAQRDLSQLEDELRDLKSQEKSLVQQHTDLKRTWNHKNRSKKENEDQIKKLQREIDNIRAEMETTVDTTIDTTDMEEDIAKAEEEVNKIAKEESRKKAELEKLRPGLEEVEKRLMEVTARNEKVIDDMNKVNENLRQCQMRQSQSQAIIEKKRSKLEKAKEIIKERESRVEEKAEARNSALFKIKTLVLRSKLQQERDDREGEDGAPSQPIKAEFTEEELEAVDIIEVPKDTKYYEAKVDNLERKLESERQKLSLSTEDRSDVFERYVKANNEVKAIIKILEESSAMLDQLNRDMSERRKRWRKLRHYFKDSTNTKFDEILLLKGSSGALVSFISSSFLPEGSWG